MKNNYTKGHNTGFGQGSDSQDWNFGFEYCKTCRELPVGRRFSIGSHGLCEVYEFKGWVERPSKRQLENNNQRNKFEKKFCIPRFRR